MADPALVMQDISKKFRKGELYDSLRDLVPALVKRLVRPPPPETLLAREFWALRDVSFEAYRGEALGIIGRNGAGKSTILKLLARIMQPTSGSLRVAGRLSALIEVGAGFHPDLTGRENIFLNGTILGMHRAEIRRKFDAIVDFSGLAEFIDTPVKRYSSGMFARLGFSVAAHVDPDVLIVDEVLSVGDFVFQRKCIDKMTAILSSGAAVVFVSHDLRTVASLCKRTLLLTRGRVEAIGPSDEVARRYLGTAQRPEHHVEGKDAYLSAARILGAAGESATFQPGDRASVHVEVTATADVSQLAVVLDIFSADDTMAFNTSSERLGARAFTLRAGAVVHCDFTLTLNLAPGTYRVAVFLHRYDTGRQYDAWENAGTLFVSGGPDVRGIANLEPTVVTSGTA